MRSLPSAPILLCLLLLASPVLSVDRHKFKTCDQSSFCKRNRQLQDTPNSRYSIDPSSLKRVNTGRFEGTVGSDDHQFKYDLTAYSNDIIRLRIYEEDERRYMGPHEALVPLKEQELNEVSRSATQQVVSVGKTTATLNFNPFRLDFSVDGDVILTANEKNLLNFEHLRTQEEDAKIVPEQIVDDSATKPETWDDSADGAWEPPTKNNPEREGRWEENFQTHRDSKPRGPSSVGLDFTFPGSKHVYGIPEHATSLRLKTTRGEGGYKDPYRLYNFDVFEYELDNEMALYGSIPFMISHTAKATTGVFWLNSAEGWIDVMEDESATRSHWFFESGIIDVFFMMGPDPASIFQQYTSLTGTTPLPPLFSLAYHQCKWNYKSTKEVAEVDDAFDISDIPYDVLWLDIEHTDGKRYFTWDKLHFQDPVTMQQNIGAKGRKMVTIIDPHLKKDSGYDVYASAQSEGILVKDRDNNDYEGHCWPGASGWIDYTNPKARDWWADRFSYLKYEKSTPILYTWNDMNEPSVFNGPETTMHKDAIHYQNREHRDVHNVYGMYLHMATAQGLERRNEKAVRPFVLSRAFFAGSQRFGAIWTGDNAGNWDHLAASNPMILSLSITGIAFSGADVGGFFGNAGPELLTRWYQAGAFQPFLRGHAHLDSKRREPFLLDQPYQGIIRDTLRDRYALLPYWYTLFREHEMTGMPVMRPLWVHYPQDETTYNLDDQYLVGRHLLVKPVTAEGAATTTLYFPKEDIWYNYKSGELHTSSILSLSKFETVNAPLDTIPVYQRGGSIIPKKERARRSSSQMVDDPYTLIVALDSKGEASGQIYIDDGMSFDYQSGQFATRQFHYTNGHLTNSGNGSLSLSNTVERIVFYGLSKPPSQATIILDGKKTTLDVISEKTKTTIRKPDVPITSNWNLHFIF